MTTTEPTDPTAAASWLDHLVPFEKREEGHKLLAALDVLEPDLVPLLVRIQRVFDDHDRINSEVHGHLAGVTGEVSIAVSDGMSDMIGDLTGAQKLHTRLVNMGIDADSLKGLIDDDEEVEV